MTTESRSAHSPSKDRSDTEAPLIRLQTGISRTLNSLITSPRNKTLWAQFRAAYETKASYPWLTENRGGLSTGLRNAIMSLTIQQENEEGSTLPENPIDDDFQRELLESAETFLSRKTDLRIIGDALQRLGVSDKYHMRSLKPFLARAINTYSVRTAKGIGLSSDPW